MPLLMPKRKRYSTGNAGNWLTVFPFLACASLSHATLNLSQEPLFLRNGSIPNIVLMLDDSGSMDWELLTVQHYDYCVYWGDCQGELRSNGLLYPSNDDYYSYIYGSSNVYSGNHVFTGSFPDYNTFFSDGSGDWRVFSSDFNRTYYNPDVTYEPWIASLSDAIFTAARAHPIPTENGYSQTRDLTNSFYITATDSAGFSDDAPSATNYTSGANDIIDGWDNHILHQIQSDSIDRWSVNYTASGGEVSRTITALSEITDADEVSAIQNSFANWYQYHRRRSFVMNAAVGALLTNMPNYRYSLGMINESTMLSGAPADNSTLSAHNASVLSTLFANNQRALITPLRKGLESAGNYLMETGGSAPITESCQQNFGILITDGYWGGEGVSPSSSIGDEDGDGHSQTLADIADYYYRHDLRPDLSDDVPIAGSTGIQHMTTFTVAFGVSGDLVDSDGDGWPEINGAAPARNSDWGDPFVSSSAKIDDLWHAAFNSQGLYTQAETPLAISSGLHSALVNVHQNKSSAAAVTVNSSRFSVNSFFYQTRFASENWSGDLLAFSFTPDDEVAFSETWRASSSLDSSSFNFNTRVVITADSSPLTGEAFRYSDLSPDYQGFLTAGMGDLGASGDASTFGSELLNYLRGKRSSAISAYNFRARNSLLGDIIHSAPVYVGPPNQSEAPYNVPGYTTFRNNLSNRSSTIYAGANDGMLHAFDADTGEEIMAFIPYSVANNLYHLADPDYSHRYYVDGPVTVTDACLGSANTCSWSSVLVAGLGGGGQGLYALNITRPDSFSESNAGSTFLWEINETSETSETSDDVGHIYGSPSVVKLQNGVWGVIVGNGYNSKNDLAKLLIFNAETGAEIATLETSTTTGNGLSTPTVIDVDRDGIADAIYAGDLQGNLWKFDISHSDPVNWGSAYLSNGVAIPLYTGGSNKPITTAPQVGLHPTSGYMVYFGTGKYLESIDKLTTGQATQGYHGIWDKGSSAGLPITDDQLLVQTVEHELVLYPIDTNGDGDRDNRDDEMAFRLTSSNDICWSECSSGFPHKGWRLDLTYGGNNRGERQIIDSILRNDRVIFTTVQPAAGICDTGDQSWLMELSAVDGSSSEKEVILDINGDGVFTDSDRDLANWTTEDLSAVCSAGQCPVPSGLLVDGMASLPTIVNDEGIEYKLISTSAGTIEKVNENPGNGTLGRQSWHELIDESGFNE